MGREGKIKRSDIKILWQTPPYADYVWAVKGDMNDALKIRLLNAYLKLSQENENHRPILDSLGAKFFLPASMEEFRALKKMVTKLNLKSE